MQLSLVQIFFLTIVTCILLRWIWSRRKLYIFSMKMPGPISIPFIGSVSMLPELILTNDVLEIIRKRAEMYSGMFCVWMGPHLHLVAIEPEDVESVFSSSVNAKPPMSIGKIWPPAMGNGVVTMTAIGKESPWKEHRKIINPSMGANVNKYYYEHVRTNCVRVAGEIEKLCDKGLVDFEMVLFRFSADSVSESLFGVQHNFWNGNKDDIVEAVESTAHCVFYRVVHFWNLIDSIFYSSKMGKRQKAATNLLKEFFEGIYDESMRKYNNNECIDEVNELSLAEVLIKAHRQGQITKSEVVDEFMNIWTAASDTTAAAIQHAVLALAMHKECQDKAFQEIKNFCGDDKDLKIEFKDLINFPYVDMCIKESLRLYSSGPLSVRYATEDVVFKNKGITVPAGTSMAYSSFLTHHNPRVWPKPYSFIPERFSAEESSKRHPFAYYPFSGGPRKCPGRAFGKMVLTTCVVHLLRKYEFHSNWTIEECPLTIDIDVRSVWGYKAKITQRKWE